MALIDGLLGKLIREGTLTLVFPKVVTAFPPGYVFLFFCLMMVLQLVWVRLMVPETRASHSRKCTANSESKADRVSGH